MARHARPGDLYELVPPPSLRDGIRAGTLRHATPGRGDASVLIKHVDGGQIAGKADLRRARPPVVAPVAWQALSLVAQQQHLQEIAGKLETLQNGVDEVLARMADSDAGQWEHLIELAESAGRAAASPAGLATDRAADLRSAATDAKLLWHQTRVRAHRHLDDYRAGSDGAAIAEEALADLLRATQVLARLSQVIVSLPRDSEAEIDAALAEEQDRLYPALPQLAAFCDELRQVSHEWDDRHSAYQAARPKNRIARWVGIPGIEAGGRDGHLGLRLRPGAQPLGEGSLLQIDSVLAASASAESTAVIAEIAAGGDVLLRPAERALEPASPWTEGVDHLDDLQFPR